jgi:hypothetical protein|nr:MAG TPA: hypothetical protein [Caudoviricetes sp.]
MPVNNDNDENDEYTRATKAVVDDTMRTDVLGPNIERVLRDYKPVNDLVKKISVDGIKNDTDTKKAIDEVVSSNEARKRNNIMIAIGSAILGGVITFISGIVIEALKK